MNSENKQYSQTSWNKTHGYRQEDGDKVKVRRKEGSKDTYFASSGHVCTVDKGAAGMQT